MHTASRLRATQFECEIDGEQVALEHLLRDWQPHDRLGVISREPFGALGASLLIQAAVTRFYDVRPARRQTDPQYPDVYLFQVGGRQGDLRAFDIWPPRKDVAVEDDPVALLAAINDRAITRLAIPEDAPPPAEPDFWADVHSLRERWAGGFAYAAGGRVRDPDVRIRAADDDLDANAESALDPHSRLEWYRRRTVPELMEALPGPVTSREARLAGELLAERADEVPVAVRAEIAARRLAAREGGRCVETYRRVDLPVALALLGVLPS